MEAIDGLTDPYAAALWLEQQFNDMGGFYRKGRFFVLEGERYVHYTHDQIENLIFDLLKGKGTQAKSKYIVDYLSRKLNHIGDVNEMIPFTNGYLDGSGLFISSKKSFSLIKAKYIGCEYSLVKKRVIFLNSSASCSSCCIFRNSWT